MAEANASGNTPAADNPANPPAGGGQTPSQPQGTQGHVVTFKSKEEYDELMKKSAQTSSAMKDADKYKKLYERGGKRKVEGVSDTFDQQELAEVKSTVASKLLTDEKYRNLVAKNPTLARILTKNPLDILEVDEFVDAEDAINQVFDYLDELAEGQGAPEAPKPAQPAETPPAPAPAPANPNPAGAQATQTPEQKKEEEFKKLPTMTRIQQKIAGRVNVK